MARSGDFEPARQSGEGRGGGGGARERMSLDSARVKRDANARVLHCFSLESASGKRVSRFGAITRVIAAIPKYERAAAVRRS